MCVLCVFERIKYPLDYSFPMSSIEELINAPMEGGILHDLPPDPYDTPDPPVVYTPKGKPELNILWLPQYLTNLGFVRAGTNEDPIFYRFDTAAGYYRYASKKSLEAAEAEALQVHVQPFIERGERTIKNDISSIIFRIPHIDTLRIRLREERPDIAPFYEDSELIPFSDGIYSVRCNRLLPRTSYILVTTPLGVPFAPEYLMDEETYQPKYLEMMDGREDLLAQLFEQLGYILCAREHINPSLLILYGETGRNGKSTVTDVVTACLPPHDISRIDYSDMFNSFSVAETEGKYLNIAGDAAVGDRRRSGHDPTAYLKKATSGEPMFLAAKGDPGRVTYAPRKFIFATNIPLALGGDGGIERRMYVIPFNKQFAEGQDDVRKLLLSPEGLTWFAMRCLQAYLEYLMRTKPDFRGRPVCEWGGKFLVTESSKGSKSLQMDGAKFDPVKLWIKDVLGIDPYGNPAEVREAFLFHVNGPGWIDPPTSFILNDVKQYYTEQFGETAFKGDFSNKHFLTIMRDTYGVMNKRVNSTPQGGYKFSRKDTIV